MRAQRVNAVAAAVCALLQALHVQVGAGELPGAQLRHPDRHTQHRRDRVHKPLEASQERVRQDLHRTQCGGRACRPAGHTQLLCVLGVRVLAAREALLSLLCVARLHHLPRGHLAHGVYCLCSLAQSHEAQAVSERVFYRSRQDHNAHSVVSLRKMSLKFFYLMGQFLRFFCASLLSKIWGRLHE